MSERAPHGAPSKMRVEAFSDGVFAIAITLLVLEIVVPTAQSGRLVNSLEQLWPAYLAYAISFLTIGVMWVNHHDIFHLVGFVNRSLLYCNIALLAVIAFIPFPTAVVAHYISSDPTDQRTAVELYGVTMIAMGACFSLLWAYLDRRPAVRANGVDAARIRSSLARACAGTVTYMLGTALAVIAPAVALGLFAVLVLVFVFTGSNTAWRSSARR